MKGTNTYLIFDGNCREAMSFYKSCLGADLYLMPFSEVPCDLPEPAKQAQDRTMHATLSSGAVVLMASDTMPGMPFQQGNNFSINLNCESIGELERLFTALGENGKVTMPPQDTFWNARFGMLTDQFGVNWMFNYEHPKQT